MNLLSKRILAGWGFAALTLLSASGFAAEYLVKYRSGQTVMSGKSIISTYAFMDHNESAQLVKVNVPDGNLALSLVDLASDPNVEYVVPNAKVYAMTVPLAEVSLKTQWAVAKIQAEKAWTRAGNRGSRKVLVAVIDTGTDYKHKNLAANMVEGFDFVNESKDPMDITSSQNPGHGTHCAGVIGSTGVVAGGTVGISPDVSIMPIRFLDEKGSGDLNNGIKAIDYAIEHHVDVISASWGARIGREEAQPLIEAIQRAEKAGIVFVVAASNDGQNNDSFEVYPAKVGTSNAIAVAASNSKDAKPRWSNYGRHSVDLAAPGDGIMSTLPNDKYGNLSGTSMATPLVAGLVALVKAQDPALSPLEIRSLLQASGTKVAINTACDCRIDALGAIEMVKSQTMFVSPYATHIALNEKMNFSAVYGAKPIAYAVSDSNIASVDENGIMTAIKDGAVKLTVTDAKGQTAQSYNILIGDGEPPKPPAPPRCPWGPKIVCEVACKYKPDLKFCKK